MNVSDEIDDDRQRRLADLAEAIRNDRYEIDGVAVADSILRHAGCF